MAGGGAHDAARAVPLTDDAKARTSDGRLTGEAAFPPTSCGGRTGGILFSNGNRTLGDRRIEVRISGDEGKTWSEPKRIVDFGDSDGGYPSCIQLPDGRVVTAYYARNPGYHDGYRMGVVTWDPVTTFPLR